MGEFLGLAAGIGMAALVSVLACKFFREMGWMRQKTYSLLRDGAVITLSMGSAYWLIGALIFQTNYGLLTSVAQIGQIFQGAYLQRMFGALFSPDWFLPVSGLFAWLAHALGSLLFEQYMLVGVLLAWGMTWISLCLFQAVARQIWDETKAKDLAFLIACLPGALFLFLPGWVPLIFLMVSVGVWIAAKKTRKKWEMRISPALYGWMIAVCVTLSAAVTAGAVFGGLG